MVININDDKRIGDIKKEFNLLFPFLKIEFFNKPHISVENSPKMQVTNDYKSLNEFRSIHNNGFLEIVPEMTVASLENIFKTDYGLFVQIFRKSGNVWLETTVTDKWTLSEQNKQGEMVTLHLNRQDNPFSITKDNTEE